jgi:hypothetical protein
MTELWLCPDLNADLLPLVEHPEQWPVARARCDMLQMFQQQVGATHENEFDVGLNYYARLADHAFFTKLAAIQLPLAFEVPALKAWSPDGVQAEFAVRSTFNSVLSAGGSVAAFSLDDPLAASKGDFPDSPWPMQRAVDPVCKVLKVGDDFGIWQAVGRRGGGITEAYPTCSADEIIAFFGLVQQAGFSPGHLHLDVDEQHAKQTYTDERIGRDLQQLHAACVSWGIPFGIIINGQRGDTPQDYRTGFWEWFNYVRRMLGTWPDRFILESWKKKNLPVNLPESSSESHTGLLREVAALVPFSVQSKETP